MKLTPTEKLFGKNIFINLEVIQKSELQNSHCLETSLILLFFLTLTLPFNLSLFDSQIFSLFSSSHLFQTISFLSLFGSLSLQGTFYAGWFSHCGSSLAKRGEEECWYYSI